VITLNSTCMEEIADSDGSFIAGVPVSEKLKVMDTEADTIWNFLTSIAMWI
jgi:hypothetical protein